MRSWGPASTGGGYRRLRGVGSLSVLLTVLAAALLLAQPAGALANQTLTVAKAGAGTGTVTSSPSGIDCGETCSADFADETLVVLTGTSGAYTEGVQWSGCDSLTISHGCKVTMSSAREVTATFDLLKRKLTVFTTGSAGGTVTSSPAGIDCGGTCSAEYGVGTEVRLSGTPGPDSEAVKWTGCESIDEENRCLVTMSATKSVTATFDRPPVELSVAKFGTGTGTVTSSPAGISCGGTCAAEFGKGTTVTLTGTPTGESEAVRWSGCDSVNGENKCVVAMSEAREVSAIFNLPSYTLTIAKQGTGTGTVTSSPAGISCGETCAEGFLVGSVVTLSGEAGPHSLAVKWSGCDEIVGANECRVTMSAAREVSAGFDLEPGWVLYTLSLNLKGTGSGSVQSSPSGISCPGGCSESYLAKTRVALVATPDPGSVFDHWSGGGCYGSAPSCELKVKAERKVNAVFTAIGTRTLTVNLAGSGRGTVTGKPTGTLSCGSTCAKQLDASLKVGLHAAASADSTFAGWSGEGCAGTGACKVLMNRARNVTATFTKNPPTPGVLAIAFKVRVKGRKAGIRLSCTGGGSACRGTLKLRAKLGKKNRRIGKAPYTLAAGGAKRVWVRLSKAALRRLKRRGFLKAKAAAAGTSRGVKLSAPKKKG